MRCSASAPAGPATVSGIIVLPDFRDIARAHNLEDRAARQATRPPRLLRPRTDAVALPLPSGPPRLRDAADAIELSPRWRRALQKMTFRTAFPETIPIRPATLRAGDQHVHRCRRRSGFRD